MLNKFKLLVSIVTRNGTLRDFRRLCSVVLLLCFIFNSINISTISAANYTSDSLNSLNNSDNSDNSDIEELSVTDVQEEVADDATYDSSILLNKDNNYEAYAPITDNRAKNSDALSAFGTVSWKLHVWISSDCDSGVSLGSTVPDTVRIGDRIYLNYEILDTSDNALELADYGFSYKATESFYGPSGSSYFSYTYDNSRENWIAHNFDTSDTTGTHTGKVEISGDASSTCSVSWELYDTVPQITSQPTAKTVTSGSTATFSVSATGTNLKYQWYYSMYNGGSGSLISGATSSSYSVTASSSNSGYYYFCKVKNYSNTVISDYALLTTKYTVTYNANGGSGAPSSQSKTHDNDLILSSTVPTRSGMYTFLGWSTSSSASSATYLPSGTYSSNASKTLYAVWASPTVLSTSTQTTSTANINVAGTIRYYKFAPSVTATYVFDSTLSSGDSYAYLYDSSGNTLTYNDDGGEDRNFKITYSLTSGTTYYYGVKFYNSTATGSIPVRLSRQYTITYNANGGSGVPSDQTKIYGETLTLSSTTPTRTGYTFLGWATSSTATSASYSAGGSFTSNANYTLYAVWTASPFTVTYDANGGSGAPSSQSGTYGTAITLSSTVPTRNGMYTFLGWSTSSTATVALYFPSSSYNSNTSITLYAVWASPTVLSTSTQTTSTANIDIAGTIRYYKFTPSVTATYVFDSTLSSGDSYAYLYDSSGNILTNNDDGGENRNFKITYSLTSGTTYYYGVKFYSSTATGSIPVRLSRQYTITYNANGGSGVPSDQTKIYGETLTLSSTTPTRTGYTFLGWATSSTATTASYSAGDNFVLNGNYTLYAVWYANRYTVTYNANGGVGAPESQEKTYGETLTLSSTIPTKEGYTFLGWATSSTATTASYSAGGSYSLNSDRTLYAVWSVEQYTIIYDANGGTGEPEQQQKAYNTAITLASTIPTKFGYTFLGWAKSSTATTATYLPSAVYNTNVSVRLYAVWSKYITLPSAMQATATADITMGGTVRYFAFTSPVTATFAFESVTESGNVRAVLYNSSGEQLASDYALTDNDDFSILYKLNSGETYYYSVGYGSSSDTGSIPIRLMRRYTINYDANGGSGAPQSQAKYFDITLLLSDTEPTRDGYIFLGWGTKSTTTVVKYESGDQYTDNADITLYAVWQEDTTKNVDYPRVETKSATSITDGSATLNGTISSNGGGTIKSARFVYRAKNNVGVATTVDAVISGNNITANVSGLTAGTEYMYYAVVVNERGSSSGSDMEFTTNNSTDPNKVTSIKLSPEVLALTVGEKTDLIVSVLPVTADDENKQYVWSTSDSSVVKVDSLSKTGNITAVGKGEATITVTVASSKVKASCKVTVTEGKTYFESLFDFSELNMAVAMAKGNGDKGWTTTLDNGGNLRMASAYLTRWSGIVNEDKFPYENLSKYEGKNVTDDVELNANYHLQDILYLPLRQNSLDNNEIKYAVMNYGAVYASIYTTGNNKVTYLCNKQKSGKGHAVAIVGWDDSISGTKFGLSSSQSGAFICKNSYGTSAGDDGYIYISYYDANIGIKERCAVFYGIESANNYNKIYQYDPLGPVQTYSIDTTGTDSFYVSNVFPTDGKVLASDENIQAIAFYTYEMGTKYELFVVPDFTSFDSVTLSDSYKVAEGVQSYAGYHTVNIQKLNKAVNVKAGSRFAVIVKLGTAGNSGTYYIESNTRYTQAAVSDKGNGYYSTNGNNWTCLQQSTLSGTNLELADFCIKAFSDGTDGENATDSTTTSTTQTTSNVEDMVIEVGDTVISHFDSSFTFPEKFDLRDQGLVSSVKNQGSSNTCWTFAANASLESSALRKYKLAVTDLDSGFDGAGDGLADVEATSIDIDKYTDTIIVAVDEDLTLNYVVEPFNAVVDGVTWESSDTSVATIDNQGHLRAYNIGKARITVKTTDGLSAEREIDVRAGAPVTGISFDDVNDKSATVGDAFLLDYTISPENAANKNVTWATSDASVVTVTKYGVIKAVGEGSAVVTCTTENGNYVAQKTINVDSDWKCTLTQKSNTLTNKINRDIMMGTLSVEVNNKTEGSITGVAILSVYDSEGRPVYTESKDMTIAEGTSELNYNDVYVETSSGTTYKLVIWSDIDGMEPLCSQLEGTIG